MADDEQNVSAVRLDERIRVLRRDVDKFPSMIERSEGTLGERIRFEIEQAFKLSDGRNEQNTASLESRLKEHVTQQFIELETRLDQKLKSDWKRQIPMYVSVAMIGLMVGFDRAWPIIRSLFARA